MSWVGFALLLLLFLPHMSWSWFSVAGVLALALLILV